MTAATRSIPSWRAARCIRRRRRDVRDARHRRGFTLIEVLVTLVLVAVVVPVAMRGVSVVTSMAGIAERREHAAALADSMLNTLIVTNQIAEGQTSGDFAPDDPGYSWTANVSEWDGPTVLQVDLTVNWVERNAQQAMTVTTLVYLSDQAQLGVAS